MRSPIIAISLLCTLLATGCTTYHSVTIGVSNKQGDTVTGASVQASPMYFFNPNSKGFLFFGAYDILYPFPAEGDVGITDDHGQVVLQIVDKNPLGLIVYAEGYSPWRGQVAMSRQNELYITPDRSHPDLVVVGELVVGE